MPVPHGYVYGRGPPAPPPPPSGYGDTKQSLPHASAPTSSSTTKTDPTIMSSGSSMDRPDGTGTTSTDKAILKPAVARKTGPGKWTKEEVRRDKHGHDDDDAR